MKTIIKLAGVYSLLFAIFHAGFWQIFNWGEELPKISQLNSAVMQILNIQMILCFAATTAICWMFTMELRDTRLGRAFLGFWALFWIVRTINQLVYFPIGEPAIWAQSAFFALGAVLFAWPIFRRKQNLKMQ